MAFLWASLKRPKHTYSEIRILLYIVPLRCKITVMWNHFALMFLSLCSLSFVCVRILTLIHLLTLSFDHTLWSRIHFLYISLSAQGARHADFCPYLNCPRHSLRPEPKIDLRMTAYVKFKISSRPPFLWALARAECMLSLKRFFVCLFFVLLISYICGIISPWKGILILK